MTTVSVHDVVAFLLTQASGHHSMSALHRMTYYAQGWHLAWEGTPLFEEEIRIRKTGPVTHALFPFQDDGCTQQSWPAGNPSSITGRTADILKAVFDSYGHMSGISLGEIAHKEAPCIMAIARKTEDDTEPVIDLTELKAFFKALDDAPDDRVAYANQFMDKYTEPTATKPQVVHTRSGRDTPLPRFRTMTTRAGIGNAVAAPRRPASLATGPNPKMRHERNGRCTLNRTKFAPEAGQPEAVTADRSPLTDCQPPYTLSMPITRLDRGLQSQQCVHEQCGSDL